MSCQSINFRSESLHIIIFEFLLILFMDSLNMSVCRISHQLNMIHQFRYIAEQRRVKLKLRQLRIIEMHIEYIHIHR